MWEEPARKRVYLELAGRERPVTVERLSSGLGFTIGTVQRQLEHLVREGLAVMVEGGYRVTSEEERRQAPQKLFFFGCWKTTGHYLRNEWGDLVERAGPFTVLSIDAAYAPRGQQSKHGASALIHHQGWTMLACWDLSLDKRLESNAAFILEGEHTFEEVVETVRARWPWMWPRFDGVLRLVEERVQTGR